jgi:hypothetical protein
MNLARMFAVCSAMILPCALLAEEMAPVGSAVTFKEGNGLLVPEATAKVIGLSLQDVEESEVPDVVTLSAQVFEAATESRNPARALAWVTPEQAERHTVGEAVRTANMNGRVAELHQEIGRSTGLVEMVIEFDDISRTLSMGSYVSVTLEKTGDGAVTSVPAAALLQTLDGAFVYTVNGDYYMRSAVQTGASGGGKVEIVDGLFAGDRIVTSPVMMLWLAELQAIRGGKPCTCGH